MGTTGICDKDSGYVPSNLHIISQEEGSQTGYQPTDGLVAHRRATSSQTGYYEIAPLWATSPQTGQQARDGLLQKVVNL